MAHALSQPAPPHPAACMTGSTSHRIVVEMPTASFPGYTFGRGWAEENMAAPRLMGDATLLPNGQVVILNGAKVRRCMRARPSLH